MTYPFFHSVAKESLYVIIHILNHQTQLLPQCVGRSKLKTGVYMVVTPQTITSYCPVDIY